MIDEEKTEKVDFLTEKYFISDLFSGSSWKVNLEYLCSCDKNILSPEKSKRCTDKWEIFWNLNSSYNLLKYINVDVTNSFKLQTLVVELGVISKNI